MIVYIPIGVSDRNGTPIHLGDRLVFDSTEWGSPHVFAVELDRGQVLHDGAPGDLSEWCEVIDSPGWEVPDVVAAPWPPPADVDRVMGYDPTAMMGPRWSDLGRGPGWHTWRGYSHWLPWPGNPDTGEGPGGAAAPEPFDEASGRTAEEHLRNLVRIQANLQQQRRRPRTPLWSRIGGLLGLGSTSATAVCWRCGYDHNTGEKLEGGGA